ncbi:eukaryotic translation initiation factor 4E [Coemansia thaxteri]|uniref:Eukaryotic translation initiation factor 4E n=1 Tax=Coemansia thaxteri TaxID=2663907 RepID=A0A9W8EGN6_9FUNG|nr:eukaryotic translation initiation factor 4E [Coemansia thaxteri]KAJ2006733.1 eukaryotic translation initiation factor 4E [Coemansia thaxteri]KAJ2466179.1 eukaryotic translation initiation factor 4E [Coemansia sp. RSA 2322]KAJ2487194.1 eukaryotic translation initiation factor 4E [Coemansia sp. RSA 2320]
MTDSQEIKTVLDDATDYSAVHALHSQWTLWFDNPLKRTNTSTWTANLKEIVTVGTVEEFWGVFNNVAIAFDIPNGSNYHLFRKGIRPMWEDPANTNGGKWGYQFQRSIGEKVNEHWLHTLLACIGETFESSPDVCGAVFSNRKNCFRIAIWTRNASDEEACLNIGRHLKSVLGVNHQLDFLPHSEDSKNPLYVV